MINIVTALTCEANPIIQHYHLKKSPRKSGFPVYSNEYITLIISGMGKFAAASATGYLQALLSQYDDEEIGAAAGHAWFNVGIAGHKFMDLGTALLAHRVSDAAGVQRYYPCFTFDLPCDTIDVVSVEQPETAYAVNAAYDMEALGFCAAASRFASFELIHCLKVISDNQSTSHRHITKHVGEELIGNQLLVIENLLHEFEQLQQATVQPHLAEDYRLLTKRLRFTVTQKNQLKSLLQRWHVLENVQVVERFPIQNYQNAKQLLSDLESLLQSQIFHCRV